MSDIIDDGNDTADLFLQIALREQQVKVKPISAGLGFCLHCGEDVEDKRRWCDAECMKAWEKHRERA